MRLQAMAQARRRSLLVVAGPAEMAMVTLFAGRVGEGQWIPGGTGFYLFPRDIDGDVTFGRVDFFTA